MIIAPDSNRPPDRRDGEAIAVSNGPDRRDGPPQPVGKRADVPLRVGLLDRRDQQTGADDDHQGDEQRVSESLSLEDILDGIHGAEQDHDPSCRPEKRERTR